MPRLNNLEGVLPINNDSESSSLQTPHDYHEIIQQFEKGFPTHSEDKKFPTDKVKKQNNSKVLSRVSSIIKKFEEITVEEKKVNNLPKESLLTAKTDPNENSVILGSTENDYLDTQFKNLAEFLNLQPHVLPNNTQETPEFNVLKRIKKINSSDINDRSLQKSTASSFHSRPMNETIIKTKLNQELGFCNNSENVLSSMKKGYEDNPNRVYFGSSYSEEQHLYKSIIPKYSTVQSPIENFTTTDEELSEQIKLSDNPSNLNIIQPFLDKPMSNSTDRPMNPERTSTTPQETTNSSISKDVIEKDCSNLENLPIGELKNKLDSFSNLNRYNYLMHSAPKAHATNKIYLLKSARNNPLLSENDFEEECSYTSGWSLPYQELNSLNFNVIQSCSDETLDHPIDHNVYLEHILPTMQETTDPLLSCEIKCCLKDSDSCAVGKNCSDSSNLPSKETNTNFELSPSDKIRYHYLMHSLPKADASNKIYLLKSTLNNPLLNEIDFKEESSYTSGWSLPYEESNSLSVNVAQSCSNETLSHAIDHNVYSEQIPTTIEETTEPFISSDLKFCSEDNDSCALELSPSDIIRYNYLVHSLPKTDASNKIYLLKSTRNNPLLNEIDPEEEASYTSGWSLPHQEINSLNLMQSCSEETLDHPIDHNVYLEHIPTTIPGTTDPFILSDTKFCSEDYVLCAVGKDCSKLSNLPIEKTKTNLELPPSDKIRYHYLMHSLPKADASNKIYLLKSTRNNPLLNEIDFEKEESHTSGWSLPYQESNSLNLNVEQSCSTETLGRAIDHNLYLKQIPTNMQETSIDIKICETDKDSCVVEKKVF